jgi:hypothetical protein
MRGRYYRYEVTLFISTGSLMHEASSYHVILLQLKMIDVFNTVSLKADAMASMMLSQVILSATTTK